MVQFENLNNYGLEKLICVGQYSFSGESLRETVSLLPEMHISAKYCIFTQI